MLGFQVFYYGLVYLFAFQIATDKVQTLEEIVNHHTFIAILQVVAIKYERF